jgi:TolA-binding protein
VRDHATLELAEIEADAGRYQEASGLLHGLQTRINGSDGAPQLRRQVTYRLGLCEFELGRHEQAAAQLEAWLDDEPDRQLVPSAHLLCAESHINTGRCSRAIEHLARLVDAYPSDDAYGPALLRLGTCHAELHNWPQSGEAFETYLGRFGESELWFQAQFGIGWAQENQNGYEQAISSYRLVTARHQGPTAARAQFQIGECLFALERFDDAVRELVKVDILYAYPEWSAAALYEAGRCYQQTGNPVDARTQYEQVRRDYADSTWAELAEQRLEELTESALPGH